MFAMQPVDDVDTIKPWFERRERPVRFQVGQSSAMFPLTLWQVELLGQPVVHEEEDDALRSYPDARRGFCQTYGQ